MLKRNAAALLVAALVLGAGAYAWAQGEPERPTLGSGPAAGGLPGLDHPGPLHGAIHADLIVPDGENGWRTVHVDRGGLSVDGDRVTVARADGRSVSATLTADTRFRGVGSAGEIRDGGPGMVVSDARGRALVVAQPTQDQLERRAERQGRLREWRERRRERQGGNEAPPARVAPDEGQVPAA